MEYSDWLDLLRLYYCKDILSTNLTIASFQFFYLFHLAAKHWPDKAELIGDLKQLCLVFQRIEKLVILAASIHRKLLKAPRLSEAIFSGYFNFYLPKMGTCLASMCYDKVH